MSKEELRYSREDLEAITEEALKAQEGYTREEVLEGVVGLEVDSPLANDAIDSHDNCREVGRGNLSSKVVESNSSFSVVRKDLKKIGRGVGYAVTLPTEYVLAFPTIFRKIAEMWGGLDDPNYSFASAAFFNPIALPIQAGAQIAGHILLIQHNPKLGLYALGARIATNLASGIYEYARHVRKKVNENPQ